MRLAAQIRSLLGAAGLVVWLVVGDIWERLVVWPAVRLRPRQAQLIVAWYMKGMSNGILGIIRAAGGRARRAGTFPSTEPSYVVMNHQSLLDIPTAVLMAEPYIPRFIARARYANWVPAVSLCMRLLGCPIIEPENRKASLRALREAARDQPHGILVFPEGHRTRDGEIQEFHTAGLEIMLRERPLPVYVLVTDGFWRGRRFVDFLFNIDRIDGVTEVMGPFPPPVDGEYKPFLEGIRRQMVERLGRLRGGACVAA
jgi:1-acyl-sn-glycerol-3-phosphate acyltransferase